MTTTPNRIVIIDDNADDRELVRRSIEHAFPSTAVSEVNDDESLDESLRASFDLVITDYQLRWTDGLQVTARVQAVDPRAPVIMFTNTGSEEIAVRAMKSGVFDYLVKQAYQYARLPAVITAALERRDSARRDVVRKEEARQHEERLRELLRSVSESEARYKAMGDTIPFGVWLAEPDGGARYFSRSFLDILDMTMAEAAGLGWTARLLPEHVEPTKRAFLEAIASQRNWEAEHQIVARGGRVHTILSRGRPVRDSDGAVVGWAGINLDITERKRIERERDELLVRERAARREAEQANRLKDEFLTTISHELRTPLHAILGWATILTKSANGDEDLRRGLSVIERNARNQTRLIEDLLDMSRIVSDKLPLELQALDLAVAVDGAISSIQPEADEKRIAIRGLRGAPSAIVRGDLARLQQVFTNLLNNSVKFSDEGTSVELRLTTTGSHAELSIVDQGIGLDPEFLPRVFDRFRQADASTTRRFGGLGLGLSIVKQLIELHGGSVRAYSEGLGKGTTFTVALPLHDGRVAETKPPPSLAPVVDGDLLRGVVVVALDDDRDSCELIRRVLGERGASVRAAATTAEAMSLLRAAHPHVLICDIGLPEPDDGYAFIRRVRELDDALHGRVPAVALTAFAGAEDRRRALSSGFQLHLVKPVVPNELVAAVARLAGRVAADDAGPPT